MIIDTENMADGAELDAEVAVVGGGFAGLELASFLGRHGVRVVLLESGRMAFDPNTQALARTVSIGKPVRTPGPDSPFNPYLPPIFRGESRIRQFGGTSNIWTGKWRKFDELDFAERSWIPHSGWPISRVELDPHYEAIGQDYELAEFDDFSQSDAFLAAQQQLAPAGLHLSFHYWKENAVRTRDKFYQEMKNSSLVTVVLGATATEIRLDENLQTVTSLRFAALDRRSFTLNARAFVLSTGGLEGARLLLASNRQIAEGIGNEHGLVGRFFMDHPKSKRGKLWPGPKMDLIAEWTRTRPRPRFHVGLCLAPSLQEERHLLHHGIYLSPTYTYQVDYPDETVARLKHGLQTFNSSDIVEAGGRLLRSPRDAWQVLNRVVYRDLAGPIAYYATCLYMEQAPNRESRLTLSGETDALGMPKLQIDWQLARRDYESFERVVQGLVESFAAAGLGHLDFGETPFTLDDMVDAAHHIGATRMAATPQKGVVDPDCRVYGTHNLFIASSSVFPTGHIATPTLTILALARRLGIYLLDMRRAQPTSLQPTAAQRAA